MKVDSFLALYRQRGCVPFRRKRKDTAGEKFVRCAGFQNFPF